MSARDEDVRTVYLRARIESQLDFYEARAAEYAKARSQAIGVRTVLLLASALTGVAGAATGPGPRVALGIAGAVLAALAAAVTGFESLIGFEQLAKLYADAATNLRDQAVGWADSKQPLADDVARVEGILAAEVAQWGQLRRRPPADAG